MKTPNDGQDMMDEWFNNLPQEVEKSYAFLAENVKKFQTFDLLSYFSYYNHLHDSETYSDYRGDKSFFISEVIALLCLKSEFIEESTVTEDSYMELIQDMQKAAQKYCGLTNALEFKNEQQHTRENPIADIASLLSRESKFVRNPGLPDHHLIFSEKLFKPIENEIKSFFGFSIADSIAIRRNLAKWIDNKCRNSVEDAKVEGAKLADEVIRFRKTRTRETGSVFTKKQLEEYCELSDNKILKGLQVHFLNKLFYTFSNTFTFTAKELAEFSDVDLSAVEAFLDTFSCGFPSLKADDRIHEPMSLLTSKPFIAHGGRYLVPSIPLLYWAVEDYLFDKMFSNSSKQNFARSISDLRHDFVLNQGINYLSNLMPTAIVYPLNLKYQFNNQVCETDGLVLYDRVLFIIEAKGHRVNKKSKAGNRMRTDRDLKRIIQKSYDQGIRVSKYFSENEICEFKPKDGKRIKLNSNQFDEIVIVSLTLEPIGTLAMAIKATNEIGYFNDGHFPWIISIYDLIVVSDLIDNPIMFIHYIRRRKKFLSHNILSTYEELDLLAYFLLNGLYVDQTLKDAEMENTSLVEFASETDAINDYYIYKFGHKQKITSKPKCYISAAFNDFLLQLDQSKLTHRLRMALLLLEFNNKSVDKLMDLVEKAKKMFEKDNETHDCTIYTKAQDGIGVTFMTGRNKNELGKQLNSYCRYKMHQQSANSWIGFGDTSRSTKEYSIESGFCALKRENGDFRML